MKRFLEEWMAVIVIFAVIGLLAGGYVADMTITTNYEQAVIEATTTCIDLGYQTYREHDDSFYCISYGTEPSIIRLGGD